MWRLTGCGNRPATPQAGTYSFGWMRNRSFGLPPRLLPPRPLRLCHPWNRTRVPFTKLPACSLGRAGRTHQKPGKSFAGPDPGPPIDGTIQRFAGGWENPCDAGLGSAFQQAPSSGGWGGKTASGTRRGSISTPRNWRLKTRWPGRASLTANPGRRRRSRATAGGGPGDGWPADCTASDA